MAILNLFICRECEEYFFEDVKVCECGEEDNFIEISVSLKLEEVV